MYYKYSTLLVCLENSFSCVEFNSYIRDSVMIDDFILEKVPGGTIVRLLGSGVPATHEWDTQYRRLRASWQAAMTRLKVFVGQQTRTGAPP